MRPQLEALGATHEDGSFVETDPEVRQAAEAVLTSFERTQFLINSVGNLFYGFSLGSVLLLAALGLGITFGLMGVINMAHGEMLMLGAYATYVVQGLFQDYMPSLFDWYVLAAIPAAFGVCLVAGMVLERGVIRFLYGRPLETLLATWGISLVLIQSVRLLFGAQNVQVSNPSLVIGWNRDSVCVVLPYSRLAIIVFVSLVVGLVWLILQRHPPRLTGPGGHPKSSDGRLYGDFCRSGRHVDLRTGVRHCWLRRSCPVSDWQCRARAWGVYILLIPLWS